MSHRQNVRSTAPAWSGIVRGRNRSYVARGRGVPGKAVGAFIPGLTRKAFEKFGFSTASLIMDWPRIAGADLALWTVPERVKWPKNGDGSVPPDDEGQRPGATLVLRVDPARALDVEYRARQIVERINSYFGYRAIAELRLLQAPLPSHAMTHHRTPPVPAPARPAEQPRQDAPVAFGDDPLGQALSRLQAGIATSGKPRA